jgi:hypothetical protein
MIFLRIFSQSPKAIVGSESCYSDFNDCPSFLKSKNIWNDTEDDRLIGELWAALSKGCCQFVMVTDKEWQAIDDRLG